MGALGKQHAHHGRGVDATGCGAIWGRMDSRGTEASGALCRHRGFVGVSGALRSTKTQQRQFARARDLRAATAVHAIAPVSYHRQRVRSLRASPGGRAGSVQCRTGEGACAERVRTRKRTRGVER